MFMAGDNVTVAQGPIGAQADTTKYILDNTDYMKEIRLRMEGYSWEFDSKKNSWGLALHKERAFPPNAVAWMEKKLNEILTKNQFLSRYNTESEMNREAEHMALSFMTELALSLKDIEITKPEQIEYMRNQYSNLLAQAIRHALYESDKDFLGKTTNETTSKIQQVITEQQQKAGWWPFKGKD